MKPILEVVSPKVQITDDYIETDYDYQTSHVRHIGNDQMQVNSINKILITLS